MLRRTLVPGFHTFDFETGAVAAIAEPEVGRADLCFNDCKVDRQGRLIGVSMHTGNTEPVGGLYGLDTDLSCARLDGGYICSNGPCWSPDGDTLYVSDSYADAIFAYDYDAATGDVTNSPHLPFELWVGRFDEQEQPVGGSGLNVPSTLQSNRTHADREAEKP